MIVVISSLSKQTKISQEKLQHDAYIGAIQPGHTALRSAHPADVILSNSIIITDVTT
jgi:hypothetical protein